jgi:hypothetical protein
MDGPSSPMKRGYFRGRSKWADPKKMKAGNPNKLVGRTDSLKRMVPEERGVYRRRYKKDD